jgi:crotonobetainyl-CoA:carnitine CoA-transferase CaiB-like acyl-CoA transferase
MLSHLRILDLTDGGASLAGRILSDLGAEVILIEGPEGVASRRQGPFADDIEDPERSLEFWSNHRGKRSLRIDLRGEAGCESLKRLARQSDVWIDDRSFPGLAEVGFDPASLSVLAPRLIHTLITPFGETGPKADWAATDLTVTAASHALWMTGDADRAPLSCSVPQAFLHAGGEAASAIMIALQERETSGLGQHIDVSAQTAIMASTQAAVLAHGWNSEPLGRSGGGVAVGDYRLRFIYECLDGFVNLTLLFGEPIGHATGRFFDWMDEEGFSNDLLRAEDWVAYGAKFLGGHTSVAAHESMMESIEIFTRTKSKAELFSAAFERKLLIVPLSDTRDLIESEQLAHRGFWNPIEHPQIDREVLHPGPFARFSAMPLKPQRPPPRLGELDTSLSAFVDEASEQPRAEASTPSTPTKSRHRKLPLEGLKVLDFTWVYAGPAVTRQLAEYGAEVIKVESSTAHDALRANGPFLDAIAGADRSANFSNVNLGKMSLGLNLRTPQAIDVVLKLIDWADVVIENFSPKAMKAWGLHWEVLRERKPGLVMLSSSLSGGTGPQAMLAGYGTMGSALAGFGFITGWPDRRPSAPYMAYTDYVSPRFAIPALLAAIDHQRRTGVGQHIDLSQAECSIHFLGSAVLEYAVNGRITHARGNASLHYAPSGVYRARGEERWIALAAPNASTWQALDNVAGQSWSDDPRFTTEDARLEHRGELDAAIEAWTRDLDIDELERSLQSASIPAHRVHDTHDAFADPQLIAREHFVPIDYAQLGPLPYEKTRAILSATPAVLRPCPTLGQHNQEILSETLGFNEDEITDLVIAGAIE